jgi:hypothetical protein
MRLYLPLILLSASLCGAWYFGAAPKATNALAAITPPPSPLAEPLLRRDSAITLGTFLYGFGSICAYENGEGLSFMYHRPLDQVY